jgi:hypothetical protein
MPNWTTDDELHLTVLMGLRRRFKLCRRMRRALTEDKAKKEEHHEKA